MQKNRNITTDSKQMNNQHIETKFTSKRFKHMKN